MFADSQPGVRIFGRSCGLPAAQNRPETVLLGLKTADSEPITAENPPDESAQVPKKSARPARNPQTLFRINTTCPESTHSIENPHDRSRIRMTWRESTQPAWKPHDSSPNATDHGQPLYSSRITQKIRSTRPSPNQPQETSPSPGRGRRAIRSYRRTNLESLEFRRSHVS